jgi:hypothetical protein
MRRMLFMAGALAVVALSAVLVSGASGSPGSRLSGNACSARWRVVATGAKVPLLSAVAAISPTDVWAVGGSDNLRGIATPVIVHWDGKRLRSYSAFKPSRRNGSYLTAISAVASDDVWAVGVDSGERVRPVVMHWDGRAWKRVTTPRVRGNGGLNGIAAISPNDVWAVGSDDNGPLVMHWNGRAWSLTSLRGLVGSKTWLSAVDGASSHDIWTVGGRNIDLDSWAPVSLHWDGRSWKHVEAFDNDPGAGPVTGHMDGSSFNAVDVSSRNTVWTLGFQWGGAESSYILRWDGRKQRVAYNYEEYGGLSALAAVSPTNVWTVGYSSFDPDFPLVVHGDGKSWRIQRTPLDGLRGTTLKAVTALSATEIWTVGNHLVARYSC